jgi:hypothetical protein
MIQETYWQIFLHMTLFPPSKSLHPSYITNLW